MFAFAGRKKALNHWRVKYGTRNNGNRTGRKHFGSRQPGARKGSRR